MTEPENGQPFPNISGEWAMEIHWHRGDASGMLRAIALIGQVADKVSMTVRSPGSDSRTIFAQPGYEPSGDPVLRYLYQVTPKATGSDAGQTYNGAAILHYYPNGELSGNYWTSQYTRGHFKLVRQMREGNQLSETVDVLLIAAIEEEYDAAKLAFTAANASADGVATWEERGGRIGTPYVVGVFNRNAQPLFRIALARSMRMGGITTGQLAATLVERLAPQALVMCGVCAGNPKDLALGDIVVSELAYQYDEGKKEADQFVPDHRQSPAGSTLLHAAQALDVTELPSYGPPSESDARYWLLERLYAGDDPQKHPARQRYFKTGGWKSQLEELLAESVIDREGTVLRLTDSGRDEVEKAITMEVDPPVTLPIAIKTGPIASGNVVVKDGVTWQSLEQMGVRSVLGLEMEAAAIGIAARNAGAEWIVIKGVMDHADPNKKDRYKDFAARASAETLRVLLTKRFSDHAIVAASPAPPSAGPKEKRSTAATNSSPPIETWRRRTTSGPFFDALRAAIARAAPAWLGKYDLALDAAKAAHEAAVEAAAIAAEVRVALGPTIAMTRQGEIENVEVLTAPPGTDGRVRIAKIWSSHDEYLGQAADTEADGFGVMRTYMLSAETTPSVQSSFAGELEAGKYGPTGVYTFPNRSEFAGEWTSGHPSFGLREFAGHDPKLKCDFYLGQLEATLNHSRPLWRPHGDGIAVDAIRRRVYCGSINGGSFSEVAETFDF